jgi:uncharacterized membrane protein
MNNLKIKVMITKEMIKKAQDEHKRNLELGSVVITVLGLILMIIALYNIKYAELNDDTIPFHVLFMFGVIVGAFGIFSGNEK